MSYDPADLTTPETHNLEDLYSKLVERRNKLDRATHFHYFPDENGRYDTLKIGYTIDQDPELNKKLETEVKRRKQSYHIEDWYKYKYYEQFPKISVGWMKFAEKIDEYHRKGKTYFGVQSLDRFDFRDVSYEWWVENYERPNKPCLISGFAEDWPITNWTYETMRTNFLGKEKVKVGKDSSGYRIGFDMKHYLQYVNTQKDDSPVYLFESQLAANDNISKVIDQYKRPVWFNKDLFDYCHAERRPPHRWICVGPERSGTTMHFDPLNTNAWNTVLAGCKLWILFPPDTPEEIAKGKKFQTNPPLDPDIEDEAVGWYHRVYPKLRDWIMKNDNKYGLIEVIQFPGETIFVGGGWWHAVLNINSDTFAVTQNYVNMTNFPAVWRDMRVERKHTAQRWLHNLRYRFPKAYQKALELDKEDGFRPKFQRFPSHCPIPDEELNEDERAIATASHAQLSQKKWESSETPFAYTGWDNVVGGDDSSTDSDSDSNAESNDNLTITPSTSTSTSTTSTTEVSTKKSSQILPEDIPEFYHNEARWTVEDARALADPDYDTFCKDFTTMGDQLRLLYKIALPIRRKIKSYCSAASRTKFEYYKVVPAMRKAYVQWGKMVESLYVDPVNGLENAKMATREERLSKDELLQHIFPPTFSRSDLLLDNPSKFLHENGFTSIPRFHYKDMTYEQFQREYERPQISCMIDGMAENWGMNSYTAHSLSVGKYKDARLKVGKDRDGYRLTMKLKHYLQYMATTKDDHPLYLFESQLETISAAQEMQQDYVRPHFFETDYFDLLPFDRRPPQRWLCIGPQGSGTTMHTDPISTNAWNTLIHGRKYWLIMSSNVPEDIADGSRFMKIEDKCASPIGWFIHIVPKIREFVANSNGKYTFQEIIQYPGQTIFVGGGQHHAVFNLDSTLAITQNYVNESNFLDVWKQLRRSRKHMRVRWLTALQEKLPYLAELAVKSDVEADFTLRFSKASIRRKRERTLRREKARAVRQELSKYAPINIDIGDVPAFETEDQDSCLPQVHLEKAPEELVARFNECQAEAHDSDDETSGIWDSSTNSEDDADNDEESKCE